jgi:pyrophosphatase PpaX
MKKYDAYLFDLDGTLINTIELIIHGVEYILPKFTDQIPSPQEIRKNVGMTIQRQFQIYLGNVPGIDLDAVLKQYMEYQLSLWKKYVTLYEGVGELLAELQKRGRKMAIVTSRSSYSAELYMQDLGIRKYFTVVVTCESTEKHKPEAEPALKAAELLGSTPDNSVMIGDSIYDIMCGRSAGMTTVFTDWGSFAGSPDEVNATFVVHHPTEILNIES